MEAKWVEHHVAADGTKTFLLDVPFKIVVPCGCYEVVMAGPYWKETYWCAACVASMQSSNMRVTRVQRILTRE